VKTHNEPAHMSTLATTARGCVLLAAAIIIEIVFILACLGLEFAAAP